MEIASWDTGCEQIPAQSWFEKGEAALCEDKHSEAADYFGQVLKANPFNAKAHCRLGNVYWAQGRIEDALNSITRALELEPGDRDTVLACTRIFSALGKDDFAKEVSSRTRTKILRTKRCDPGLSRSGAPPDPPDPPVRVIMAMMQPSFSIDREKLSSSAKMLRMLKPASKWQLSRTPSWPRLTITLAY